MLIIYLLTLLNKACSLQVRILPGLPTTSGQGHYKPHTVPQCSVQPGGCVCRELCINKKSHKLLISIGKFSP